MGETQHFRLAGTTNVEEIDYDHVDGHNVIYWEDIEQIFPGVKHVKNGNVSVKLLRDSNRNRIIPHCIKYHPGIVLDVVLSPSSENTSAAVGRDMNVISNTTTEAIVESLEISQPSEDTPSSDDRLSTLSRSSTLPSVGAFSSLKRSRTSMSFKQIATLARQDSTESKLEQLLVSSLPSELQVQVRASTNVRDSLIQAAKNGQVQQSNEQLVVCLQELSGNVMEIKNMASMIMDLVSKNYKLTSDNNELLTRVNEMQTVLDSKQDEIKGLQIQALDRLALLQKSVQTLLTQTYELHEYPIPRLFIVLPQDTSSWNPLDLLSNKFRLYFLCECGEHTKSINSKIPHHIHLAKHEGYDIARPNEFFQRYGPYVHTILQMLKYGFTVAGVAIPALSHLVRPDAVGQVTEGLKLLTDNLEPGMNQVMDYIEKASAEDGQTVVGISEQMDNNEALEGADLRQLESFLKTKDESRALGNLYRTVTSEGHVKWVCIDHFRENYQEKAAKSFRETVNALQGQFDENIGRVEVTLKSRVQAEQLYQALGSARSVYELKLVLDWDTTQGDFKRLQNALTKTSVGVLELQLWDTDGPNSDILNRNQRYDPVIGIMRHPSIQSFSIKGPRNFSKRSTLLSRQDDFSNLRHLDISQYQLGDDTASYLISKAPGLSTLALDSLDLKETGSAKVILDALANASTPGFRIQSFTLLDNHQLGDPFLDNISSVVGRSELSVIRIWMREDERRVRILESIQWKYLRWLTVCLKEGTFETSVMRALVDGVTKMSEKVELEEFQFLSEAGVPLTLPEGDLLRTFLSSMTLKDLRLKVDISFEQTLSLCGLTDFSRLESLKLWTKRFDSAKVDAILDGLQHATRLNKLILHGANITDEQKKQTMAKGTSLQGHWNDW
ncbi:hypothetical protein BGX34_001986 [Mortierella sp. NVP85]|nr:hypothetical protein BGX34_001986 [Mortierella sp. NVP85]